MGPRARRRFLPSPPRRRPDFANRLAAFARTLRGRVVAGADPDYGMLAEVADTRYSGVRPLAIVVAADETDVAKTIGFVRDEGLPFAARNGGHSFAGYSITPGIVIDLRSLTAVKPDPARATAIVGAGMTNLPLYEALWPHRMVVPAGTCPTVGISGLSLGGGFGRLSPLHGLTSDNLLGVRMVMADGRIMSADEHENADLLWACRGGGGGNFGVVTELSFRLQPADMPFTEIEYTFGREAVLDVLRAWQGWITQLPREGHSELQVITGAPTAEGGVTLNVNLTYAGEPARAEALARDLVGATGARPTATTATTGAYVSTERDWICAGLRPDECTLQGMTPHGKLPRYGIFVESDFVFAPWPDAGLERIIEAIDRRQKDRTLTPADFEASTQVGKFLLEFLRRRDQRHRSGCHRVPASRHALHRAVPVAVAAGRRPGGCRGEHCLDEGDVRFGRGLPFGGELCELQRSRTRRLAARLLRSQPHPAAPDQGEIRSRQRLPLRAVDPARVTASTCARVAAIRSGRRYFARCSGCGICPPDRGFR